MSWDGWPAYVALGFAAGTLSGLVGVGGGILMIPAMALLFGMSQHDIQGTTLAVMVPPVGLLAALTYYKHGHVNVKMAALICAGFVLGGWLGAHAAVGMPQTALRRVCGIVLLAAAVRMIVSK